MLALTSLFQGYKVGAWKDYKEPSNVFDALPELANADHKVTPGAECLFCFACSAPRGFSYVGAKTTHTNGKEYFERTLAMN